MSRFGMKSFFCIVLCSLLVFLCSCSSSNSSDSVLNSAEPVTLTLWHYYVGDNQIALEEAVTEFNQTVGIQEGIIVEPVGMGSIANLEEKVTASAKGVINSEPMPDLFSSYPDVAYQIDLLGKLTDLNVYFTEEEKGNYISAFLQDGIYSEDRFLLMPIVKSTELLYVNATAWNKFCEVESLDDSALETWESLYEAAKAYYQWTDALTPETPWDGTSLAGFDSVANYIIISCRQLGVEVIQATDGGGRAVLDTAVLRRVFDLYYQGYSLGYFGAYGNFRSDDIKQNELISYVGSSSGASYFPDEVTVENEQIPIDFLFLPFPTFEGGDPCAVQQGAGMCVSKSDEAHKQGAAVFLKWFTAPEQNISFAMTTGYLPVTTESYESDSFTGLIEQMEAGSRNEQIVAGVYRVALEQITQQNTYSASPFEGSYTIRSILQSTLMGISEEGLMNAADLKQQGMAEQEILQELDPDSAFHAWMEAIQTELDYADITWVVQ